MLADAQPARAPEAASIPEVLVTARRVEEDLQSVPVSVQVVSGEFLDNTGVTRWFDLQHAVPGLVLNTVGMFGAGFSLRGIADQRVSGLSVAPYLNGVYLGDANLAIARIFDLERIEVLKGPQGTLYGRNSTGGSINAITRSPQRTFSADLEASYGSFDTVRAQGHLNLPFRSAAFRLAFIASEGNGYIRNTVDDRRFGEEDFAGLRAALRIAPQDDLDIEVMAQHVRDDGASSELWSQRPDFLADPDDIRLTTVTLENPYLISEVDNVSATVRYDLGFASLQSITGYARSDVRNLDDCAGLPFLQGCVRGMSPGRYVQWSQEFQLAFARRGAVDALMGAYYSEAEADQHFHQTLPLVSPQPLNDYRVTGDEAVAAVFGQATLHWSNGWSATGGVRLVREEQSMRKVGAGLQDVPPVVTGAEDANDVSWRLDLQRAVTDDAMFYVSVSTGYKSGGFLTATLPNGEPDRFESEYVTAYELGGKTLWMDRRLKLNAAAFVNDFDDLQVTTTDESQTPPVLNVDNAARAKVYGMDVELDFNASDRVSVSLGAVWLPKREFVEFDGSSAGGSLTGNTLVRAPEWTAIGALIYERPLLDRGMLSARLEYSYRSGYFYTPDNDPAFAQDGFGLLNLFLRFEGGSGDWYLFASGRNLTEEDYFNQVFIQSSPGYPDTYELGAGFRF